MANNYLKLNLNEDTSRFVVPNRPIEEKEKDLESEKIKAALSFSPSTQPETWDGFDLIRKQREAQNPVIQTQTQEEPQKAVSYVAKPIKGSKEFEDAWNKYSATNINASEVRDFLTRIAKRESNFQSIQNKAGAPAYGYFQLWKTNLGGYSPEEVLNNPDLQIKLAIDLDRQNMRTFTESDFARAEELGYTKNALRAGAWLGGVGGVRAFLHQGQNRDDKHWSKDGKTGASVKQYMDEFNFKLGGTLPVGNKVKINDKEYSLKIAENDLDKAIGLSKKDSLPNDEGMLFIINEDEKDEKGLVWFTMEDTKFPLDIIFINEDLEVVQVSKGEPLDKSPIYGKADYVLEVNTDSKIKVGDTLKFNTDKELSNKMLVLDSEGDVQMALDGGERIVSRRETKIIINKVYKADALKNDSSYQSLGKYIFKVLERQNNNEPEYV